MGSHPINLALRFLLEIAALLAMGAWGWRTGEGALRFVMTLGVPLVAAVLWGTFAVLDDPSRSGKAPVPVPGLVRLALELGIFALAVWALQNLGATGLSWVLGALVLAHYATSYDRVLWLIKR